jgi:hypothetical protein
VTVAVELKFDEEYPDGEAGGGVGLLYGDFERVRSTVRMHRISLTLCVYGVGGRPLTGLKSNACCSKVCLRNSCRSRRFSMVSWISRIRSCSCCRMSTKSSKSLW